MTISIPHVYCVDVSGAGGEIPAEREMKVDPLHATLALGAQQIHPGGVIGELLLLDGAEVSRADSVANLGELQRTRGVVHGGGKDRFTVLQCELARERVLHVAESGERGLHVLSDS